MRYEKLSCGLMLSQKLRERKNETWDTRIRFYDDDAELNESQTRR